MKDLSKYHNFFCCKWNSSHESKTRCIQESQTDKTRQYNLKRNDQDKEPDMPEQIIACGFKETTQTTVTNPIQCKWFQLSNQKNRKAIINYVGNGPKINVLGKERFLQTQNNTRDKEDDTKSAFSHPMISSIYTLMRYMSQIRPTNENFSQIRRYSTLNLLEIIRNIDFSLLSKYSPTI